MGLSWGGFVVGWVCLGWVCCGVGWFVWDGFVMGWVCLGWVCRQKGLSGGWVCREKGLSGVGLLWGGFVVGWVCLGWVCRGVGYCRCTDGNCNVTTTQAEFHDYTSNICRLFLTNKSLDQPRKEPCSHTCMVRLEV